MVLLRSSSVAALVSVPGPLSVDEFSSSVVWVLLKLGVKLAIVLSSDSVPRPPRVPAS